MKMLKHKDCFYSLGRLVAGLVATVCLMPALRAQPTEQNVQSRFLFVFDTSSSMKPRIDAVKKVVNSLLVNSMSGRMRAGDSIGVWAFAKDLNTSEFPPQTWNPDSAALIASNITRFVDKQRYSKTSQPEVLQPLLNRVVKDSERLTVLIFCDGDGKFTGTPYDDPINKIFKEHSAEQKKANEPIMIVLRSQLGEYVGAGASLPPRPVNVPEFPPLPKPPPPPPPKQTNAPPPPPVVMGQPLIIIGKKPPVGPAASPTTNPPPVVPEAVPKPPTNAINKATNSVVAETVEPARTNLPPVAASSRKTSGPQMPSFQRVSMALFGVALVLGLVLVLRPRRKDASLITRSMDDRR